MARLVVAADARAVAGGRARAARRRSPTAEELVRLGRRLADAERSPGPFGNEAQSVMDVWRGLVMVAALGREEYET